MKKAYICLSLVLILLLTGCVSPDTAKKSEQKDKTAQQTEQKPETVGGMSEYVSDFGYKVSYPKEYSVDKSMSDFLITDPDSYSTVNIVVTYNNEEISKKSFENAMAKDGYTVNVSSFETLTLNGEEAYRIDYTTQGLDGLKNHCVKYTTDTLIFTATYTEWEDISDKVAAEFEKIITGLEIDNKPTNKEDKK